MIVESGLSWWLYYRDVAIGPSYKKTAENHGVNYYYAAATYFPNGFHGKPTPSEVRCSPRTPHSACRFTNSELGNAFGVAAAGNDSRTFVADAKHKVIEWDGDNAGGYVPYGNMSSQIHTTSRSARTERISNVADAGAKNVWEYARSNGTWSVIGTFADPYGVAVGPDGAVYVADPGSKHVWKLTR